MNCFRGLGPLVALIIIFFCDTSLAADCGKEALSAIVSKTSEKLSADNKKKTAEFQRKLRILKKLNGWSDEDFISKAEPLVKNSQTAAFDEKAKQILADIAGLNQNNGKLGCATRDKFRDLLQQLVDNNDSKWAHLMKSIDKALSKIRSAARTAK